MKWLLSGVVVAALVVSQLALLYWVETNSTGILIREVEAEAEALLVPIERETRVVSVASNVELTWSPEQSVIAVSGLGGEPITQLNTAVDGPIHSGDLVALVGNEARMALQTPTPFHRVLSLKDSGRDVEMLQEALVQLGLIGSDEVDSDFGRTTAEAVKEFQRRILVVKPDGIFRPHYVMWLPAHGQISDMRVSVGEQVSARSEVLRLRPRLTSLLLRDDGNLADLGYQMIVRVSKEDTFSELELQAFRPSGPSTGSAEEVEEAIWRRIRDEQDGAGVAESEPDGPTETQLPDSLAVELLTSEALEVWVIPGSSILGGPDGEFCAVVAGDNGNFHVVDLIVVQTPHGVEAVAPLRPSNATEVVVNPFELLPSLPDLTEHDHCINSN